MISENCNPTPVTPTSVLLLRALGVVQTTKPNNLLMIEHARNVSVCEKIQCHLISNQGDESQSITPYTLKLAITHRVFIFLVFQVTIAPTWTRDSPIILKFMIYNIPMTILYLTPLVKIWKYFGQLGLDSITCYLLKQNFGKYVHWTICLWGCSFVIMFHHISRTSDLNIT